MRRAWKVLTAATMTALLAVAAFAAPNGAAANPAALASCTPATNIEAIVDDSGSMEYTDENKLRVQGMDLLIDSLPSATELGAVEFGSEGYETPAADTVFPREPVGPNGAAMRSALATLIQADNGSTDYNAAFAKADADNPTSQARIFLTDGGHDVGTYNEAHLAHNVPTYVIGLGLVPGEDTARLEKIANDTGAGPVYEVQDAGDLPPAMNRIGAALTCQTPPREFKTELGEGQKKSYSVAIGAATRKLQIALSWASPSDRFKVTGLKLLAHGKLIGSARPKVTKLKVKRTNGTTFSLLKVSNLRKGTLRITVKAAKIGSGAPKVKLTTQVGRGSR